jgi:ABC-type sugar transport system substrate-binding protein
MKKVLAIVLVMLMALSLFACGNGNVGQQASNSVDEVEDTGLGEVLANGTAGADYDGPKTVEAYYGFFDNEYDYSKDFDEDGSKYKIAYVVVATNVLYDAFSEAFQLWAERYNCDYVFWAGSGDTDAMVNQMYTLGNEGVDAFLIDPDSQTFARVTEVCDELVGDAWMSCMSFPYGNDGLMNHPFVGFDNPDMGRQEAEYLINYAKENFEGFDPAKAVMINCDYSISSQIHERGEGVQAVWEETYPEYADNFINLDLVSGTMVAEDAYNDLSTLIAQTTDVDYWLIAGTLDTYGEGCARAAEEYGIADNTVITVIGGTGLINQWSLGNFDCWRSAVFTPQTLYGEPIFGMAYYMMRGWCTPEEVWQDYTNSVSNGYGWMVLASFNIEEDTYQDYLEWVDWHSGFDYYKFEPYDPATGEQYDLVNPPMA